MTRLPIRLRLTLGFAVAMALVLTAVGLFLYLRLETQLDRTLNDGLRSRAADVTAIVRQSPNGLARAGQSPLVERGESFAQVLDPRGRITDATPQFERRQLLTPAQVQRARRGTLFVDREPPADVDEDPWRLLATPLRVDGRRNVIVVGESLDDRRNDPLQTVAALLLIGGPVALLLASGAGYALAAAALRPVERMRRRAAAVSTATASQRLPVPPGDDEVTRLGRTLNEMLERLEAAFNRERTFVADASHELRTPLAILKAELELALRQGRSPEELREAIASATEEVDRLSTLAEELLVIARADQGRLPVHAKPVDVGELMTDVARRFERQAGDEGRRVQVLPGAGGLSVNADRTRAEQALGNLVENALRHGDGPVSLGAVDRDDVVELHVKDEGAGFPPEFLDSAFERFARANGARQRGGAGLGLAIVEAIARLHGGYAGADNRPEGGADVWVALPRVPGARPGTRQSPVQARST